MDMNIGDIGELVKVLDEKASTLGPDAEDRTELAFGCALDCLNFADRVKEMDTIYFCYMGD